MRKNFFEIYRQFGHASSKNCQPSPRWTAKYYVNVSGPSDNWGLNLRPPKINAAPPYIIVVGAEEFWKSLVTRTFTWINFHTGNLPIIGTTVLNSLWVPCTTYFCAPAWVCIFRVRGYLEWGNLYLIELLLFFALAQYPKFLYGNSEKHRDEVGSG
jgi:hypothetical protein